MAKDDKKSTKQSVQKSAPAKGLSRIEEMERMFDNYFSHGWLRPFHVEMPHFPKMASPFEGKTPSVDVINRDNEIVVKAELPGVNKKDLDVTVTSNTVTIKGTTSHEDKEEKGDYYRCEMSRGSYTRTLPLPAEVDESKSKATFKDGVLELTVPKLNKSKRQSVKID